LPREIGNVNSQDDPRQSCSDEDEGKEDLEDVTISRIGAAVAQEVDEDQLFQDMLSQRRPAVVRAVAVTLEPLDAANGENQNEKEEHGQNRYRNIGLKIASSIVLVLVVAGVVTAVVVSKSTSSPSPPPPPSSTSPVSRRPVMTEHPTEAPISRIDSFRSILLNHSVVSDFRTLYRPDTKEYAALNWLANQDPAMLNISAASVETIINRYVVALIYFADGRSNWKYQLHFLSRSSICNWNNGATGKGVFCLSLRFGNTSQLGKR
jgi:hypothetical protein